ncbi:acylneuraminate cytidylyltransferase family protein [Hahella sp. CR1]|uniref:acylneuraminate cytidylyltransferase family protein n=1 Tax=Hahella sp. CR1 TaxID=2992807 RepID=UPI002442AA51|nr:acylneuraminate cytidylyltransferase family protein [Hahella sp. CR1]MDG9668647.1 acylneuraminate cytidylyltransferase family protein [Hahella sp. CR1]
MIDGKRVLAIIPARGGSKGLPGKNIRPLCGVPLVGWPIRAALQSRYVDRVLVSTDSPEIAEVAKSQGAEVPFLRPDELAGDCAPTAPVLLHTLDWCRQHGESYDYLVLLEPTSPLTEATDVDKALEMLFGSREAQAIVGVADVDVHHPVYCAVIKERGLLAPYQGGDFAAMPRRQDIPDVYYFDGTLYISTVEALREKGGFYHDRTLPYVVPKWKALDVDTLTDFICVEAVMQRREELKSM